MNASQTRQSPFVPRREFTDPRDIAWTWLNRAWCHLCQHLPESADRDATLIAMQIILTAEAQVLVVE